MPHRSPRTTPTEAPAAGPPLSPVAGATVYTLADVEREARRVFGAIRGVAIGARLPDELARRVAVAVVLHDEGSVRFLATGERAALRLAMRCLKAMEGA